MRVVAGARWRAGRGAQSGTKPRRSGSGKHARDGPPKRSRRGRWFLDEPGGSPSAAAETRRALLEERADRLAEILARDERRVPRGDVREAVLDALAGAVLQ